MDDKNNKKKKYDVVVFGVTGFTGKLTVEYLWKNYNDDISWAACARNRERAEEVLREICHDDECNDDDDGSTRPPPPPLLITADLVCTTLEQEQELRDIVRQTKVVLTCAGPFETYGTTLVKLCAQEGVCYADITGETDFFRTMISLHDTVARDSGAIILSHCGNDCIPQDLTVYEMHQYAMNHQAELTRVTTFVEFPETTEMSGGTATTAAYQLGKDRRKHGPKTPFDPLLQAEDGTKSEYSTKNVSPKSDVYHPEFDCKVGPWIMGPVMVNCIRRSNALLHYSKDFEYGDAQLKNVSWMGKLQEIGIGLSLAAAIYVPPMKRYLLPQPGEGPNRETMEAGYLTLHGRGTMKMDNKETHLVSKFHFGKDVAYLYTAVLLVETGMLLLEKQGTIAGGVMTPAVALGSDLTQRILEKMDATFEIREE